MKDQYGNIISAYVPRKIKPAKQRKPRNPKSNPYDASGRR